MDANTSKKNSAKKYPVRKIPEINFISGVMKRARNISEFDLQQQKMAMQSIINYIHYRKNEGADFETVENEVYYFMENFMDILQRPNLTDFYRMRTCQYIMDTDLTKYCEQIIEKKIDIMSYEKKNVENVSVNIEGNIIIEICGILSEIVGDDFHAKYGEFGEFCDRVKTNQLTQNDAKIMNKYIRQFLNEVKIGKANTWKNVKRNSDDTIKRFLKNVPNLFEFSEIEEITEGTDETKISIAELVENQQNEKKQHAITRTPLTTIPKKYSTAQILTDSFAKSLGEKHFATYKPKFKTPFISNDQDNNLALLMNELIMLYAEKTPNGNIVQASNRILRLFILAEKEPNEERRNSYRNKVERILGRLHFERNLYNVDEALKKRLAVIIDFFDTNGELQSYCDRNNSKLERIKLGDLQIDQGTLFDKFINSRDRRNLYFTHMSFDSDQNDKINYHYSHIYEGTPIDIASQEAVIGMSGFYTNRLAKEAPKYSRNLYLLTQKDAIKKAYDDDNLTIEDLEYTDDNLSVMMAMCDEIQIKMKRNYYDKLDQTEAVYEEKEVTQLKPIFADIKRAYNNYFKAWNLDFDLDRDIPYLIKDIKSTNEAYKLKDFSVKSLIYTAMTDKNKNIINWGYVTMDEQGDESKVLIGFDIKDLNMPVYYHMDKEDLISLIKEITGGNAEIPIYLGGDDMYSYTLKQRLTTQILFPLSKAERKTLAKVSGYMVEDPTYKHIKWLQKPSETPFKNQVPGGMLYNLETGETRKVVQEQKKPQKPKKPHSNR